MSLCIECARLSGRQSKRMVALGFGQCSLQHAGRYFPLLVDRDCERFMAANPQAVEERRQQLPQKSQEAMNDLRDTTRNDPAQGAAASAGAGPGV